MGQIAGTPPLVTLASDTGVPYTASGGTVGTQATPNVSSQQTGTPTTGEFAPGVAAAQFPSIAAKLIRIKARLANTGSVWVGDASDVTVGNGVTDTTSGFQLSPGDDSGWLPVANLNVFFGIGDNATDSVTYMVLA